MNEQSEYDPWGEDWRDDPARCEGGEQHLQAQRPGEPFRRLTPEAARYLTAARLASYRVALRQTGDHITSDQEYVTLTMRAESRAQLEAVLALKATCYGVDVEILAVECLAGRS